MKRLIKNRKGTAEVIGTIMFIMILLFFFTGVYLWHDAATKDANGLYLQKINSTFSMTQNPGATSISITAGGSDIVLARLWIIDSNGNHLYATDFNNVPVAAGQTIKIDLSSKNYVYNDQSGNPVSVSNPFPVKCWVINTLGVSESCIIQ